jgi:transmembrane sensor
MNLENFKLYTADDFILDEEFRDIVRESDTTDQLKELLESLPEKRIEINLAIQVLHGLQVKKFQQPEQRKKELWQFIHQSQKSKVRFLYFRVAASLLLLLGIGSAIYYSALPKQVNKVVVAVHPVTVNATLILADGKKVSIGAKQSKVQYSADGSGILVNDSSKIAQSAEGDGLNQMIVPYGKRSFVMLAEGTKVWLNSGSMLVFPPVFKSNTREVYLEGEALFEVTKDKTKPFIVKTERFKTKVYGTRFNVQAYEQDEDYSVVLVEGKVGMNSNDQSPELFLAPNQKATLSKGQAAFEITTVENTSYYTAWVDGYLAFNNEAVPNVLKRVSRYYNVTIETELANDTEKIFGKLDLKDDLGRVMDGLAFISKTKYEKRGNKYVFMNN